MVFFELVVELIEKFVEQRIAIADYPGSTGMVSASGHTLVFLSGSKQQTVQRI